MKGKVVVWLLFAACLLAWTVTPARATIVTVHIFNFDFSTNPKGQTVVDATIHAGDTIHWVWDEGTHSTTSVTGSAETWDSGLIGAGSTFDHTFTQTGVIVYFCKLHGTDNGNGTASGMSGTITVLPLEKSLSPASANAGGPAFTMVVKGIGFKSGATVKWTAGATTTNLTTTVVSGLQLKAAVPASLIASPGKASVTVANPDGGTSNAKPITILVTTLKLVSASLTRDSSTGVYSAIITLKNVGFLSAPSAQITASTLGAAATSTALPVSLGSIAAGASASTTLTYPASAGTPGTLVPLKVMGRFTGGKFSGSLKVTLPQ